MNSLALALHVLAAVVWVGGMFFAYNVLRPSAGQLEPPQRLRLWATVFPRFFAWVWGAVLVLPASGVWLMARQFGGIDESPAHVHLMVALGVVMIIIFMHVFFAPYRRLSRSVAREDWTEAGKALNQIRYLIGLNLALGLSVIVIAAGGRL